MQPTEWHIFPPGPLARQLYCSITCSVHKFIKTEAEPEREDLGKIRKQKNGIYEKKIL